MQFVSNTSSCQNRNYGKCRCCLALGKHQHNFGKAELEMLMENLNLFLMVDPRLPQLLCFDCITSLNEVLEFRRKVLSSESELRQVILGDIKTEIIVPENVGQMAFETVPQSSQNDPLDIGHVKGEHDYEVVDSVTVDDTPAAGDFETVKIEACGSRDSKDKTTVKIEDKSNSFDSSDEESNPVTPSPRKLRLVPKSGKGLHPASQLTSSKGLRLAKQTTSSKGLRLAEQIPKSSKGLQLAPQSSKGLHCIPVNKKGLCLVPINSKGLRLVKQNVKGLHLELRAEPVTDDATVITNVNEITISENNKKRRINDADSETQTHKKKDTDSDTSETHVKDEIECKTASNTDSDRHLLLIDNSKVRSNIILILQHSTIMPFRNNFKFAFKCFYCDKLYIPFKELKEHIESEHIDVSIATITKIVRSMQNLIVTADISCLKCKLCDEKCESIDKLIQHLCENHGKVYHETDRKPSHGILGVDLSTDTLKCHICSQDHTFFKNLLVHMNEHYGVFVCYVCGKKFLSERRYKSHVISTHENKEIKCKQCSKVFKTEPAMKYHVKRVHLKTRVKCLYCPETFTSGNYVKRLNHMAEVHGIAKPIFKCDMCGKELANSASLAHHRMYTHKRTKVNTCEICGYMTCDNSAMKKHMVIHTGEKNFECEFCKKRFAKLDTLKLHLKIHLNDKRFVCVLCDAAFIQKNSLKNHLQSRHPDSGVDINNFKAFAS